MATTTKVAVLASSLVRSAGGSVTSGGKAYLMVAKSWPLPPPAPVFAAAPPPAPKAEWTPPAAPVAPTETLTSAPVAHHAAGALGKLMGSMLVSSTGTLDDVVRELLKPMLKEWLDANLPQLVEAEVAKEIDRIRRLAR